MYCIEPSSKRWYVNNITSYRKERKIHSWFSIVIHSLKITSISIGREIILISYYTELSRSNSFVCVLPPSNGLTVTVRPMLVLCCLLSA